MAQRKGALKKDLSLFNVYALATGATLSSGFFLLPGLAAAQAGPTFVLSYMMAAVPMIPTVFSMAELSTAMPKAGGVYYYMDRSMGPLWGTISGMGTWLALTLKAAFALIGMGAYLHLLLPAFPMIPLAIVLATLFGTINLWGTKKTGKFQAGLVLILLAIIAVFISFGLPKIHFENFKGILPTDIDSFFGTAGLVFVSYVGLTKIASVSEEVEQPEKNLPRCMMAALVTAIVIYGVGTSILVGVLSPEVLAHDLTPVASAAQAAMGDWGATMMIIAALMAFLSVANSGILSASRYPLAMSRDHLVPRGLQALSRYGTPKTSIIVTVVVIILWVTLFDPTKVAKLASAFQLVLCAFSCLAVIVMRESRIESYDPGYRSPFYPWTQIIGIGLVIVLINEMGTQPILFTAGLIVLGTAWYWYYARDRVVRSGAIYHIFARLGERRFEGLDRELRGIMKEKGLREEDPFDVLVARAEVIDYPNSVSFNEVLQSASHALARRLPVTANFIYDRFLQGTRIGATPVSHGAALPHIRLADIQAPELVIVRSKMGVNVDIDVQEEFNSYLTEDLWQKPVFAFFFLASPDADASQHLRILAEIAERVDDDGFMDDWLAAAEENSLREVLIQEECFMNLTIKQETNTSVLIGKTVRDMNLPDGCLIALIGRDREIIVPRGQTILEESDYLTFIGDPIGIEQLRTLYQSSG